MAAKTRALEHPSPVPAILLALAFVVISIVLILPR
jgi:hypothetical protein